jgi:hypothetical protein
VETEHARRDPGAQTSDSATRASLQLELRVPDKQMFAIVRDTLLRWLNDRTGALARAIGLGNRFFIDEQPPTSDAYGMSTMRVTVSWQVARSRARVKPSARRPAADARTEFARPTPAESFIFVPLADAPLHADFPDEAPEPLREPYPRLVRRPRAASVAATAAARLAAVGTAIYRFLQESLRGFDMERLMIRLAALATHPRVRTVGLLGSAAVATGVLVGTVYLETSKRFATAVASPSHPVESAASVNRSGVAVSDRIPDPAPAAATMVAAASSAPTLVASADAAPQVTTSTSQPASRRASGSERPSRARVREIADAKPGQPVPAVAPAEVATTGFALPGDEVITSGPLPDNGRMSPAKGRRPQVAAVRAVGGAGLPQSSVAEVGKRIKGTLLVKSDPQGAEVSINGVVHGRTPLMIRDLGVGSRVVRLELAGYERWSWAVSVVANKRTPLNVKLRPDSRGVGKPD